ncbi:MAG: adenylate/guanylate cyclase domain-containing protein [Armatimonadota bacterium]|nr:adenylate/guanylate cyclase domain-containing protein [Armatimonadota bacterium]
MRVLAERWLDRLADIGAAPTDTAEERLRKSLLIFVVLMLGVVALTIYSIMYWALGLNLAAAIPFAFQVMALLSLLYLSRTKDFTTFRNVVLFMALTLPVSLQWALGGFAGSGAVLLWSAWPAIGQLMFEGPQKSITWFAAYLGLLALSAVLDPMFPSFAPSLPPAITALFFAMNIALVTGSIYVTLGYFAFQRDEAMAALNRQHLLLQKEQERSEHLLLSILPKSVADRLKHDPTALAEECADATVLFADIVDFTRTSSDLPPEELIAWLNDLFSAFDRLTEQFGLEKIKTIGDAYMAVCGLPARHPDHAGAAAEMALAILAEVTGRTAPNGEPLSVRIGMHSGRVVAGVIGTRKFIYDLWGDTVNIASRMESQGVPGGVQVTQATYARLHDRYEFTSRGQIFVKGKGLMAAFLLTGRKSRSGTTARS